MLPAILGTKKGQTQMFTPEGVRIPVTVVSAGPCVVLKTTDHGEFSSVQLAYGQAKHVAKPVAGIVKKAGSEVKPRFLREVRTTDATDVKVGDTVAVGTVLAEGDLVRVTGISKGKGFAGVVKRHHFKGGPNTHGQSNRERSPGSIGQTTTPGRVYRGKRMAGRMGGETVTVRNLKIVKIDGETNTVYIKGLVPGGKNGLIVIRKEE
jgi:large subunit ribosomal protein L3